MFPIDTSGATPPSSLPAGWTAYTDVNTSRTYYVHLPTGDTQWSRPPPPPGPPPQLNHPPPSHPPPQPIAHSYPPQSYSMTPTTPLSGQSQYSSQVTASNGWSNSADRSYNPTFNQNHRPPPPLPPTLSLTYNPHWQSKRLQYPAHDNIDLHYNPPAKRQRVLHHNISTTITEPESRRRKCSKCNLMREWKEYSKRQWLSCEASRKCKVCVVDEEIETSASEKEKGRLCSLCRKKRPWESFSKTQWVSRIEVRKCKSCVDNHLHVQGRDVDVEEGATTTTTAAKTSDKAEPSRQPDVEKEENASVDANKRRSKVCSSDHREIPT